MNVYLRHRNGISEINNTEVSRARALKTISERSGSLHINCDGSPHCLCGEINRSEISFHENYLCGDKITNLTYIELCDVYDIMPCTINAREVSFVSCRFDPSVISFSNQVDRVHVRSSKHMWLAFSYDLACRTHISVMYFDTTRRAHLNLVARTYEDRKYLLSDEVQEEFADRMERYPFY